MQKAAKCYIISGIKNGGYMENTVVIVEENIALKTKLEEYFTNDSSIKLAGSCDNGPGGVDMIKSLRPTFALIDCCSPA